MVASLSIADLQMLQLLEGPLGGITNGPATILAPAATDVPLTIKGAAAQTGDLQQWQNSAAAVLSRVLSDGGFVAPYIAGNVSTGPYLDMSTPTFLVINRATITANVFAVRGMAGQTAALQVWQDNTPTAVAQVSAVGTIKPLVAATGARPSAVTYGAGHMMYDTTLSKPIWSDGTIWRDAIGIAA